MSGRRAIWEVARRELMERLRSRVLRLSLVLLLLLAVGGAIAAARLSGGTPTDDIGLVGPRSVALEPAIRLQAKAAGRQVRLHPLAGPVAAASAVRNGSIDVALLDGSRIVVKTSRTGPAIRVVEQAVAAQGVVDRLRGAGLTQAQALSALTPPPLPINLLEPRPRSYDRNRALVLAGLFALFMALVFFGQALAQGVTEEKSSRVVELLLTTVSPRRLLAGKVLGIGLLGLALLLIPGAAALAAGQLAGGTGLPSAAPETIALILLWFVLGYFFYSVAFAAVGALVSRQEDLNTAILPISAVLTGAFYLAVIVTNTNPNGTVARVAAFLPPFAPMVVPARMILGDMNGFGLALAVVLELIGTAALILLAARAYERAILRIGAPVRLRRLFGTGSQRLQGTAGPGHETEAPAARPDAAPPRLSRTADVALRAVAVILVIAGAVIGFGRPIAIALVAVGLLLLVVRQTLTVRSSGFKRRPHKPAH
jgi:ABC-2 type transport system permease protein